MKLSVVKTRFVSLALKDHLNGIITVPFVAVSFKLQWLCKLIEALNALMYTVSMKGMDADG